MSTRNREIEKIYIEQLRNIETVVFTLNCKKESTETEIKRLRTPLRKPNYPSEPSKPDIKGFSLFSLIVLDVVFSIIIFKICSFVGGIFSSEFIESTIPWFIVCLMALFLILAFRVKTKDSKEYKKRMKKYELSIGKYNKQLEKNAYVEKENYKYSLELEKTIGFIDEEIKKAKDVRNNLYSINWVPIQYRNIKVMYYICDMVTSADISLEESLKFYLMQEANNKLDEIIEKLDYIIQNQKEIILNQAIIQSQNKELINKNNRMINQLASIEDNTKLAADYSAVGARYSEVNAFISMATYLNK